MINRTWDSREESQSVFDGIERDEEIRLIKQLKLDDLIKARGPVARTHGTRHHTSEARVH